jgi:hypothetical protein
MTRTATALSTEPRIITKLPVLRGSERPREEFDGMVDRKRAAEIA